MDLFALALQMMAEGDDKIAAQLTRLQSSLDNTARHVSDLDKKFEQGERTTSRYGDALRALAGLAASVAVGAFFASATREVDEASSALIQLDATARSTGRTVKELRHEAERSSEQFALSTGTSAKYTATIARLVTMAHSTVDSHVVLNAVLDITASRGLKAADGMAALEGALRGSDRAVEVLLQRDLAGDFDRFARSLGITTEKLSSAQRAQVLLAAIIREGEVVRGKYAEWLETAAGRSQRLSEETAKAKEEVGKLINPIRELGTAAATTVVKGMNPLLLAMGASAVGLIGIAPSVATAIHEIDEAAKTLGLTMSGLAAKAGAFALLASIAAGLAQYMLSARKEVKEALGTDLKQLYFDLAEQEEKLKDLVDRAAGRGRFGAGDRFLSLNYEALDTARLDQISMASAEYARLRDKEKQYVQLRTQIQQLKLDIEDAARAERKLIEQPPPPKPGPAPGAALTAEEQDAIDDKRIANLVKIAELQGLGLGQAAAYMEEAQGLEALAKESNVTLERRVKLLERAAALAGAALPVLNAYGVNPATLKPMSRTPTPLGLERAPGAGPKFATLGDGKPIVDFVKLEADLQATAKQLLDDLNKSPWLRQLREMPILRAELAEGVAGAIADGLALGISEGIARGNIGAGFQAMTRALLGGLGSAMVQFGKKALLMSTLMDKIKKSITSLLPGGAIAASLAMIAIGAALQGAAAGLFGGSGGGGGDGGSYSGYLGGGSSRGDSQTTRLLFGPNSSTVAAGLSPQQTTNVFVIGPNDPVAQRQLRDMINRANQR